MSYSSEDKPPMAMIGWLIMLIRFITVFLNPIAMQRMESKILLINLDHLSVRMNVGKKLTIIQVEISIIMIIFGQFFALNKASLIM